MRVSLRSGCSVSQENIFSLQKNWIRKKMREWGGRGNVREIVVGDGFRGVGGEEAVHGMWMTERRGGLMEEGLG
jgi:hypothetical protein